MSSFTSMFFAVGLDLHLTFPCTFLATHRRV